MGSTNMKRVAIVLTIVVAIGIALSGCSGETLTTSVSGDTVVAEYTADGVRQLITDDEDVKTLTEVFSMEYSQVSSFDGTKTEYIIYFGHDLDIELNSYDGYTYFKVIGDVAYAFEDEKVYKSTQEVDLSVLDKYRMSNPN